MNYCKASPVLADDIQFAAKGELLKAKAITRASKAKCKKFPLRPKSVTLADDPIKKELERRTLHNTFAHHYRRLAFFAAVCHRSFLRPCKRTSPLFELVFDALDKIERKLGSAYMIDYQQGFGAYQTASEVELSMLTKEGRKGLWKLTKRKVGEKLGDVVVRLVFRRF